jgi:hypothetical protein
MSSRTIRHVILSTGAALVCLFPVANADAGSPSEPKGGPFDGRFTGPQVELTLGQEADVIRGTLVVSGTSMSVEGRARGSAASGRFQLGGSEFSFEARVEGTSLVLSSDNSVHRLERSQGTTRNPLGTLRSESQSTDDEKVALARLFPEETALTRDLGLNHPRGWKQRRLFGMRVVVPDDAMELPLLGPTECYGLLSTRWKIGRDLRDKESLDVIAAQVLQVLPFVERVGQASVEGVGEKTRVKLSFHTEMGLGLKVRADAYATIQNGQLVVLLALGEESAIVRRAATVARMFTTVHNVSRKDAPAPRTVDN